MTTKELISLLNMLPEDTEVMPVYGNVQFDINSVDYKNNKALLQNVYGLNNRIGYMHSFINISIQTETHAKLSHKVSKPVNRVIKAIQDLQDIPI
jgi:hypothetical protein